MKLNNHTKIIFFIEELGKVGWNNVYSLRYSGNLTPERGKILLEKGYFEIQNPKFIEMFVLEKKIPVNLRKELFLTGNGKVYNQIKQLLDNKEVN